MCRAVVGAVVGVAAATTLLVAWGCGGGDRQFLSERSGGVVFTRWIDDTASSEESPGNRPSLLLVASDGSQTRVLARDAADASVAPDGRRLAFVRDGAIWSMRRDGTGQRQLTRPDVGSIEDRFPGGNATVDGGPAWSPDGRTVYFSRFEYATTTESIFSVHDDGTGIRRLTEAASGTGTTGYGEAHYDPAPSPNGRIVAYSHTPDSVHGNDVAIYAMTTTGKARSLAFAFPAAKDADGRDPFASGAAWSPDGGRLAYTVLDADPEMNSEPVSGLYVSAADGSNPRRLAAPKDDFWSPAWSPDGGSIAFVSDAEGDSDIWLVGADGSGLRQLTRTEADDFDPAWLPPAAP